MSGTVQDWSDKQMARAPDFSANLGADYTWQLPVGSLLLGANVSYSDSYVINNPSLIGGITTATGTGLPPVGTVLLGTSQRFPQDPLTLVNASLTWTHPDSQLSVGVFGNNLSDKKYRVAATGLNFGDYGSMAEPRTYGIKAGYKL